MGSCTAKRNKQRKESNEDIIDVIAMSPSTFIIKSDKKFRNLYKIKKKVGGGKSVLIFRIMQ